MSTSTKEHVENILNNTFKEILRIYQCHQEEIKWKTPEKDDAPESRLIFPRYGKHRRYGTRISEQELRFVFVEQFNKYCKDNEWDVYYSVETPTENKYRFSPTDKQDDNVPREDDKGQSASTDLTIHDSNGNRICLIEFKAHNPGLSQYKKDFLKLLFEPIVNKESCESFFVQLLEKEQKDAVDKRLQDTSNWLENQEKKNIHYRRISLTEDTEIINKEFNETHPSSH